MESLTLEYQDVERLLNCLDGQARLPTAMHSFPLTHAEPPAELVLPTGRTLGVLTLASAVREYRIDPQNREPLHGQAPTKPNRRAGAGAFTRDDEKEMSEGQEVPGSNPGAPTA